jgi:ABC-type branched-subunit amino acid transport system substrate-binding protein
VILVALAMLAVSCSGDDAGSTSASTPETTRAPVTSTTAVPAPESPVTTTTTAAPDPIAFDGVTVTDEAIYLGILADLSGPFSGNVVDLIDAQLAFWADLNESGGIAGRQVELLIANTSYDLETHQLAYVDLKDRVLMFSHSTGSPHTRSIADDLFADDRLAIPVSWYSGWADPELGTNVLEVGSNYCAEAMNTLSFIAQSHEAQFGTPPSIAIATDAGDYGQDSAAGARHAATELNLTVAYDGEGLISFGSDLGPIAAGIAQSGADYTWLATDPISMSTIVSGALNLGYEGAWSGAMPTFSPRLLDTALGPYLSQAWFLSVLYAPVGADVAGMEEVYAVLAEAFPDRFPSDGLIKGYLEFAIAKQLLERAAAANDLTPEGILAVARDTEALFFDGISPDNVYSGTLDESVARATAIYRPSKETFDAQGGLSATFADGAVAPYDLVQDFFVSDLAADYRFDRPCYLVGP